jgi:predicted anti-sigma-YlaC factor YlaD
MTCHHYKQALQELAAACVEPSPELHAHLQACSSCRSAFENERSLFVSIESCLHSSATAEIPASFIPTVRAQIQQEVHQESPLARASARLTDRLVWASAFAAAAILLFIFTRFDRQVKPLSTDEQLVTQQARSPVAPQTTGTKSSQSDVPQITPAIGKSFVRKAATTPDMQRVLTESRDPEILVPPDQEILLARYADRWSRHHQSSSILLTEMGQTQTDPLQVPLIQIAELDVKPLAPDQRPDQKPDQKNNQKYDQESDIREE